MANTHHTCSNCSSQIPPGKEVKLPTMFAAFGIHYLCDVCDTAGREFERLVRVAQVVEFADPTTGKITKSLLKHD